jgi:hemerythrin
MGILPPPLTRDLVRINPGAIVLRQGAIPDDVLLILSGTLERVQSSQNVVNKLSAGTMIGTAPVLESRASSSTYRAVSFVRALAVPAALYATVVRQSGLEERISQSAATAEFLRTTQLFGEDVPEATLTAIADGVQIRQYAAGKLAESRDLGVLNVVTHGRLERVVGNDVLDTVEARDFFGEEEAVFGTPGLFRVRAVEDTETLQIPGDLVKDIPIVRWKLFESYLARASMIVHAGDESQAFIWRDEFSVQNAGMDTHHMKLIEIANGIAEILMSTQDRDALDRAMGALVDYTHYHFSAEEELMERYQYPGLPSHRAKHRRLEQQVAEYREGIEERETLDDLDFTGFLERWLISHVLDTDRRYGAFLNAQGVF